MLCCITQCHVVFVLILRAGAGACRRRFPSTLQPHCRLRAGASSKRGQAPSVIITRRGCVQITVPVRYG